MPNRKGSQYRPSEEERQELRARFLAGESRRALLSSFAGSSGSLGNILQGLVAVRAQTAHEDRLKKLEALAATDVGWIAGILDGEGYIGLSRLRDGQYYQARVLVCSTTLCMQTKLFELVGGHVCRNRRAAKNCRETHVWSLWSIPAVRAFLSFMRTYLVVKRDVADVVLRFCERHTTQQRQAATKSDVRDYMRVRKLNKRGLRGEDSSDH